jgi:hypothetical protein
LGRDEQLAPEVNLVLYFAAAAVAWLRHGERITHLSDWELCDGLQWAVEQPWIDESTRDVLTQGRAKLLEHAQPRKA